MLASSDAITPRGTRSSFIPHLHAFRGVAIILIACAHAWSLPLFALDAYQPGTPTFYLGMICETLFHDSTLFFALISGLLYSMVLKHKGYKRFFRSKFVNVVSPYIVFTLLFTYANFEFQGPFVVFDGSLLEYAGRSAYNLVTGQASFPFWYIPVLVVLFALTPVLDAIVSRPGFRWLAILLVLSPLVFSRPAWPDKSWTTIAYFLGAYLGGMLAGLHYEATLAWCRRHAALLAAVCVASSGAVYAILVTGVEPFYFIRWEESFWYLQKMSAAGLILLALRAGEERLPGWLAALAGYAFTIYFVNGFITVAPTGWLVRTFEELPGVPFFVVAGFLMLFLSLTLGVLFAWGFKRLAGRYSRMLIGA